MVYQTFLKKLKFALPVAALSTTFLFSKFETASAMGWGTIFQTKGIVTKALDDPNKTGMAEFFSLWGKIGHGIVVAFNWLMALPENMPRYSVELLAKLYELLTSTVLYTPLFLFNNSLVKDTSMVFAGISILVITILTMIEGIKKMLKKKHTDWKKILKRYALAIVGAGSAPFLFEKSFQLLNTLSKSISAIGAGEMGGFQLFDKLNMAVGYLNMGFLDTLLLFLFDIVVVALLIPIILQTGRRWFDLLTLSMITPLSLSAWIFDDYRHYFNKWWSQVKLLGQTQLIYAIYICIMGVLIFGTANTLTGGGMIAKILVIIGALFRMVNPPQFIKQRVDNGDDIEDMGQSMWKTGKKVYDTVTLKNLKTMKFMKDKSTSKQKTIQQLRKKHGQRYVKNLI